MPARILIVDDEPNILGTVAPLLRARGYDVSTAMDGRSAMAAVDRDKPDLIVLDLGLPDIDGVDLCRNLREVISAPIAGAVRPRRRRRQGARAGCGRGRLRDEAVRRRGTAGADSRGATSIGRAAVIGTDRPRRAGHRPRALSSRARWQRGSPDAERV